MSYIAYNPNNNTMLITDQMTFSLQCCLDILGYFIFQVSRVEKVYHILWIRPIAYTSRESLCSCNPLKVFNFLFDDNLCILEALTLEIKHPILIVVLIYFFKNLLADFIWVLFSKLSLVLINNELSALFISCASPFTNASNHFFIKESSSSFLFFIYNF